MIRFKDISIRRKLRLITMLTSIVVLLLACMGFITYETIVFRSTMSENLLTLADIIGANSTAALTFNDQKSAEETLSALEAENHVVAACIYTANGEVFASFVRDHDANPSFPSTPEADGTGFRDDHLLVYRAILMAGEKIGTVYIQYDLLEMYSRLKQYALIAGLVMIVSIMVALALSSKLQRVISEPVLNLARTATSVSAEKNYGVRARKHGNDELGDLIDVFNEMLSQIQVRDLKLQSAHDDLERRVAERTKELQQEITEHKRTELELESSLSVLHATIESTADGILVVDKSGRIVNYNHKFVTMWRIPQTIMDLRDDNKAIEHVLDQLVDPDVFVQKVKELYAQENADSFDVLHFKDGRVFERYSHPQRISGISAGRVWSFHDVTERRRADEVIREQATLLEKAQDAILARGLDHSIRFWNKSAERLYGWTAEEALGKSANELLFQDEAAKPHHAYETVLAKNEWIGELHQITKDGKPIVVESRWSLVRDNEGRPKSILVINTDVTEKKHLEAQFLRAQRMESIGTLAAGIAHDINNILSPILMAVDILKDRHRDDHTHRMLGILETNANRGADLVRQVLGFARGIEGERLALQLKHLIKEIEKIAKETFPRSVQIHTDLPKDLWPIAGDPTHMHQVLLNLCVNARDAINGEGSIIISAENMVLDEQHSRMYLGAKVGSYVLIKVTDTGSGIPKAIIDKIFDPFFTTKERGKGTGLGLSTVVAIVKSHSGFINVYSEVGKGTTFKVYLPASANATVREEDGQPREVFTGDGEVVLVVDDEVSIQEITREALEKNGYNVLSAADGKEALSLFLHHQGKIDLVLTDMMMPNLDGPATIRAIREMDKDVRIVAVSGLTAYAKNVELTAMGVQAFLPKPYTSDRLLKTLWEVLRETKRNGNLAGV